MITCSFHGNQLGVGYRVPDGAKGAMAGGGHKDPATANGEGATSSGSVAGGAGYGGAGGGGGAGGAAGEVGMGTDTAQQKIVRTGLADVSGEVIAKGRPEEIERLVKARPELAEKLKATKPLLAQELAGKRHFEDGGC